MILNQSFKLFYFHFFQTVRGPERNGTGSDKLSKSSALALAGAGEAEGSELDASPDGAAASADKF